MFDEFHRTHPGIRVVNAGGLELPGTMAESNFLMSMAGDTAPDVFYVNFRNYFNYIDQGFCRPLDDLIAKDPEIMERVNPDILKVVESYDGKRYALPWYQVAQGLYYRKDHFQEAGLDPNKPPKTWDEFYACAKALTASKPGRSGFSFGADPQSQSYYWVNFLWQAGGEVVVPAENGYWKSAIATDAGVKALEFFRRLTVDKWKGPNGIPQGPAAQVSASHAQDIKDGKVSMWFSYTNDVVLNITDINPSLIGIAAMPAGPAGSYNEINAGMWAINASITDPAKIQACWEFIKYYVSQSAAKVSAEQFIEQGLGQYVNPQVLKEFGHENVIAQVDPGWVAANQKLFQRGKPEPYGRNCSQVYTVLDHAMDEARLHPERPAMSILKEVEAEMNQKLLGFIPEEVMAKRRTYALVILLTAGVVGSVLVFRGLKNAAGSLETSAGSVKTVGKSPLRFIILALAPAVLSLLVWAYYPLLKGLVIAFQDYRIAKPAQFVGLDNFIDVFTQPIFYKALLNSFLYVILTISIGFFLPIILAVALNEIPRAKVFFRTVFYLPAMTSPIIIAFLWRQFYDKSPNGLLNSLLDIPLAFWHNMTNQTHIPLALDWLGSEHLALLSVVLPGIWAGAGPGSILYLAALKNIPDERYEAADLDGADWKQKIRRITLPGLKPLMLINLLGVFIGSFKAMENVFVLTAGGPANATQTIGLEVWQNAFMFLKFGYATAAAWVMGAILIGFTIVQIKQLTQMKFSAAKA